MAFITAWLTSKLGRFGAILGAILAVIVAILTFGMIKKREGRREYQEEQEEELRELEGETADLEQDYRNATDEEKEERFDKWVDKSQQ